MKNEIAKATVYLDGKQAEVALEGLKKQAKDLRKQLKAANDAGDFKNAKKLAAKIKGVDSAMRSVKKETYDYQQVLKNINGASYNELNKALQACNRELKKMKANDPGYKQKEKEVQMLKARMQELTSSARAQKSTFGRVADSFNRYFAVITAGIATVTGLFMGIKQWISGMVDLDDQLNDVRKTTGLTSEDVRALNQDFKTLNTRTSRQELRQLAEQAGRLGIEGRKDILEFVRVANEIKVALGDDLGGDAATAIKEVGKLTDIYRVGSQYGTSFEESMSKVGSALNEVSANSSASAAYQIDYLKRLGGTAMQAQLTAAEIIGYASTLDQLGQKQEMAATAHSKVILDMFSDTAKYAEIAGMELKDFSGLLNSNANEAFLKFLEGLNGNNEGLSVMSQKLDDLGIDGARAVSVLATLSGNIDKVRAEQDLANKAMKEGVSLTNEYNVKNESLAGSWEKLGRYIKSQFVNSSFLGWLESAIGKMAKLAEVTASDQLQMQAKEMNRLVGEIIHLSEHETKRFELLEKLKTTYPDYYSEIDAATISNQELSNKLNEVNQSLITQVSVIQKQEETTETLKKYKKLLITIGIALATYTTRIVALTAVEKLRTVSLKKNMLTESARMAYLRIKIALMSKATITDLRQIAAIKAKGLAMKSTPWGLVIAGLTAVIAYTYQWYKENQKLGKELTSLNSEVQREKEGMDKVFDAARKAKEGTDKRREAIQLINQKYGDYIGFQLTEKSNLEEITKAQNTANASLIKSLALKSKQRKIEDLQITQQKQFDKSISKLINKVDKEKQGEALAQLTEYYKQFKEDNWRLNLEAAKTFQEKFNVSQGDFMHNMKKVLSSEFNLEQEIDQVNQLYESYLKAMNVNIEDSGNEEANTIKVGTQKTENGVLLEWDGNKWKVVNPTVTPKNTEDEAKAKKAKAEAERQAKYRQQVINEQKTLIEQEKIAHQERLINAGLYGKDRENLTQTEFAALEALEATHKKNLETLDTKAHTQALNDKQKHFEDQLRELRTKNNEELAIFEGTAEERKKIQERQAREENAFIQAHLKGLIQELQAGLQGTNWEGLKLSDDILSEEEKEVLVERLKEATAQLAELRATAAGKSEEEEEGTDIGLGDVDILGFSGDDWEEFNERIKEGSVNLDDMRMAVKALANVWTSYSQLQKAKEDASMAQYEKNIDKKKQKLKSQLDKGLIDQDTYNQRVAKLDADLDKKKSALEYKQAKRQQQMNIIEAIMNTAVGITKALSLGLPLGPIVAALVAATGAIQLATIKAQTLPGREKGGYLVEREDGKKYNASYEPNKRGWVRKPTVITGESGSEFVLSNEAVNNPSIKPVVDIIDMAQRQGTVSSLDLGRIQGVIPGRENGGYISDQTNPSYFSSDTSQLEAMVQKNTEVIQELKEAISKPIKAYTVLSEFQATQKKYQSIINDVTP